MNYLIVNSTSHCYELILGLSTGKIFEITYKPHNSENKDDIIALLDKFLKQYKFDIEELNFIGAITGPGSYTGLRVGLSLVNTIGLALNIPIIGVSIFDILINSGIKSISQNDFLLATVPTYKCGLFGQFFYSNLSPVAEPIEILNNVLPEYIKSYSNISILTTDMNLVEKFGLNKISVLQKQVDITTENINNTILTKYKKSSKINNYPLEVLYIKLPNITIKKD